MRYFLFLLVIHFTSVVCAETLLNAEALKSIKGVKNWPIVDVRELSEQSQSPIPGSLDFSPALSVKGKVLLVASDNAAGILLAKKIESKLPSTEVFVLDGGFETLRTIWPELRPSTGGFSLPGTFTIPSDTCESGDPLQIFTDEEKD